MLRRPLQTSYEARALGISKLSTVQAAKKICPELLVVNGEDLTNYRRFSREIWSLVRSFIQPGGLVERLGMDELFMDITDQVDDHLASLEPFEPGSAHETHFAVGETGFEYRRGTYEGHRFPLDPEADPPFDERLAVSTHFAKFVRDQINQRLGFTTSGGVATNKTLAKLVASLKKPNQQSYFQPSNPSVGDGQLNATELFLEDFNVEK